MFTPLVLSFSKRFYLVRLFVTSVLTTSLETRGLGSWKGYTTRYADSFSFMGPWFYEDRDSDKDTSSTVGASGPLEERAVVTTIGEEVSNVNDFAESTLIPLKLVNVKGP